MTPDVTGEGGYSLVELLIVMVVLGIVLAGITTLFSAGINADADQNRRFQAQQSARLALDEMRRQIHAACTVSNPTTYNTWESSVTLENTCSTASDTWCTVQLTSPTRYALYKGTGSTCGSSSTKVADYLVSGNIFLFIPPDAHVTSMGAGSAGVATVDGSNSLPRLHVDLTTTLNSRKHDEYRLFDDIAFLNGVRECSGAAATC